MGAATEVGSWQLQHLVLTQNRLVKGLPTWADERRGDAAPKPQAPSLMGVASVRGGDLSKGLYQLSRVDRKLPRCPGCWEYEGVTEPISHENILGRKEISFKNLTCMYYRYFKTVFRGKPHYFLHIDIIYIIFWSRKKLWLFDTHTIDQKFPKDMER